MPVDSATKLMLEGAAAAGGKPLAESTPTEARALSKAFASMNGPGPAMARVEDHEVPVAGGSITVRVLVPPQRPGGALVYYHGGGWVIGSIDDYEVLGRKLAERTSCAVVLVDYRLAPEHRYPAAADDAYSALKWTAANLGSIAGRDGVPLIVAGDSAGGNLAAVVAQQARDRGGPKVDLQVLIYPVTDCDVDTASYTDPENQLLLTKESMVWFWDHYAPDPARRAEPAASPLRAADLAGLPPAVVATAEYDVLRDEGEAYADRLRAAGVPVDFKRHLGQTHGFFQFLALPGSELGFQQVVKAVRACVANVPKGKPALR
ncbi:MAG: alpha/beta hydrolase [Dehalococcoidia bacterium]